MVTRDDTLSRRLRLILGGFFALVVVVLAAVLPPAFVSRHEIGDLDQRWLPARTAARNLLVSFVDQETGERGFVITGRPDFLAPYNTGKTTTVAEFATLRRLLTDAPGRRSLDLAQQRYREWRLKAADPEIALVRAGRSVEARQRITAGTGKESFDALRRAQTQVVRRLDDETRNAQRRVKNANTALFVAVILGTLLAISLAIASRRWLRRWSTNHDAQREIERSLADQTKLLASITATSADAIFLKDANDRYVFVNPAAAAALGRDPADVLGQHDEDVVAADDLEDIRTDDASVRASHAPQAYDEQLGDRIFLSTKSPYTFVDGSVGVLGVAHDITARRLAEGRLATIAALSRAIAAEIAAPEMARATRDPIRRATEADVIWLFLHDREHDRLVTILDDGTNQATADEWRYVPVNGPTLVAETFRTATMRVTYPRQESENSISASLFDGEDLETVVDAPLAIEGVVVGVLSLGWRANRTFPDDEFSFFESLARVLAEGFGRARATAAERAALGVFQRALLPRETFPDAIQVAVRYEPAAGDVNLGGDWYDVFELPDGLVGIAAGDVVGHGVDAAAVMGQLRSALRALARIESDPGALLTRLDEHARAEPGATATTVVFATLDRGTGDIRYSCAGHMPPLVMNPGEPPVYLDEARGIPIGLTLQTSVPRVTARAHLKEEGVLAVYTDGLIERRGASIDTGFAALAQAIFSHGNLPVEALADQLLADLGTSLSDDTALLLVRLPGEIPQRLTRRIPADGDRLRHLRSELREWLAAKSVPESVIDDAVLGTIEAVTNSIEHGYQKDSRGQIVVEAVLNGDLLITVRDHGRWAGQIRRPGRGRGMKIMESIMDECTWETTDHGTIVRMRLHVGERDRVGD